MTIYEKLLEVQKEIGTIKKDSENPYFHSKYFDINSLLAEVKPVLNKYDLILIQPLSTLEGKLALVTKLIEAKTGEYIADICPIPEGADAQKTGSAITYFRRYALQSLLALEAEDDDGNSASVPPNKKSSNRAGPGVTGATRIAKFHKDLIEADAQGRGQSSDTSDDSPF